MTKPSADAQDDQTPGVFGTEVLQTSSDNVPLHTAEPGLIPDIGDLCDADCVDCD